MQIADTGVSFMSFGTNDLTQTTYGFSRDDMARFLPAYIDNQVMEGDPFIAIDQVSTTTQSIGISVR